MFNIWKSIIYCVKLLISQILGSLFLEIKHLPSILFNLSQAFGPNIYRSLLAMMIMAERLEFAHPDDHTIWTANMPGFKPQHTCWTCMLLPIFSTGWKKMKDFVTGYASHLAEHTYRDTCTSVIVFTPAN